MPLPQTTWSMVRAMPPRPPPGQGSRALVHLPRLVFRGTQVGGAGQLLHVVQREQQQVEAQGAHAQPRQRSVAIGQVGQPLGQPARLAARLAPRAQPAAQLLLPGGPRRCCGGSKRRPLLGGLCRKRGGGAAAVAAQLFAAAARGSAGGAARGATADTAAIF